MIHYSPVSSWSAEKALVPKTPGILLPPLKPPLLMKPKRSLVCSCHHKNNPNTMNKPSSLPRIDSNKFNNTSSGIEPVVVIPTQVYPTKLTKNIRYEGKKGFLQAFGEKMLSLCGFGYWVQGFRCFPWLALNFHMAHNLELDPSTLQLVQNSGNLPMVAKPLYGIISDAVYINGAHRIPYISLGVLLQVLSWGPLALIPAAREALPNLMACVILSNTGASITEVAMDALVAEFGQKHKMRSIQSYAFMASAAGGILGNLLGGYILLRTQSKTMFLIFAVLLSIQFAISSMAKEASLGLSHQLNENPTKTSISESIKNQLSDLIQGISEQNIFLPLVWIVASIVSVPILSGSIFCYQTQCLNLNPLIIGMSRVVGQLVLLSASILFDRYLKKLPMRKLISVVQALYACSLLLDFVLVRQINLKMGIPNDVFSLCFSGLAETISQFKLLPFMVLFANLCPRGCEGSVMSFLASALCFSSIVSGFLGVGLASLLGIAAGDYTKLPVGILIQFVAALLPLGWVHCLPMSPLLFEKERRKGLSKRTRKKRRVGRVVLGSIYAYRRERDFQSR